MEKVSWNWKVLAANIWCGLEFSLEITVHSAHCTHIQESKRKCTTTKCKTEKWSQRAFAQMTGGDSYTQCGQNKWSDYWKLKCVCAAGAYNNFCSSFYYYYSRILLTIILWKYRINQRCEPLGNYSVRSVSERVCANFRTKRPHQSVSDNFCTIESNFICLKRKKKD